MDTEQKTLGQINAEGIAYATPWHLQTSSMREVYENGAKAVEAAVLARQTPAKGAELNKDQLTGIAKILEASEIWGNVADCDISRGVVRDIIAKYLALRPQLVAAPTFFVTREKAPTMADADASGFIQCWDRQNGNWDAERWDMVAANPDNYPAWTHQPPAYAPPEVDEEETAFKTAYDARFANSRAENPVSATEEASFRAAWNAAKEHFTKEGK